MRLASQFLAGLAAGALSLSPVLARHHGHVTHSTSHHQADSPVKGHDEPQTVTAPDKVGDGKDEPRHKDADKGLDSDDRRDPRKPEKGTVSSKDHRITGERETREAPPSVDTRITVHQGREPRKARWHQFGQSKDEKSKLADAPGAKRDRERDHDHRRREADDKRSRNEHRNALGTKIDADKRPAEQRTATGLLSPTVNSKSDPKASTVTSPAVSGGAATPAPAANTAPPTPNKGQANGPSAPITPSTGPTNVSMRPGSPVISGAVMIKPVARTGAISGAPKIAGVISGNNVRVRHP